MRDFFYEALLQDPCGNNRPGHLGIAYHGNNPALLPMKTWFPKRVVPRDQSPSCSSAAAAAYFIYDFRGVAWGLLLGTSFASTKRIVRGIVKGGPAFRASMFIILITIHLRVVTTATFRGSLLQCLRESDVTHGTAVAAYSTAHSACVTVYQYQQV